jgi:hypothetical protein
MLDQAVTAQGGKDRQGLVASGDLVGSGRLPEQGAKEGGARGTRRAQPVEASELLVAERHHDRLLTAHRSPQSSHCPCP